MQIDYYHGGLPLWLAGTIADGAVLRGVESCPSCGAPLILVFTPEEGKTPDIDRELADALTVLQEAGCGHGEETLL